MANLQLKHGQAQTGSPALLNRCTSKECTLWFLLASKQAISECRNMRWSDIPALIESSFCHGFDFVYKFGRVAITFPRLSNEVQTSSNLVLVDISVNA